MQKMNTYVVNAQEHRHITISEVGIHEVNLIGPAAEATIVGSFHATGAEQKSVTVVINHQAAHTRSSTILKGVASDSAQIYFTGKIKVAEHCPDTNAFLTERILLLSDTAVAHAVPDLEILTDDVKCSHAASISHIPDQHLFYLMSRGLTRQAAQDLIVDGFLK